MEDKDNVYEPEPEDQTGLIGSKSMEVAIKEKRYRMPGVAINRIGAKNTTDLKVAFIERYIELASISRTCEALGMNRRAYYDWMEYDPEFKALFTKADKMALGVLEDEAHRRAVVGVARPVFQGGKKVGEITEYSDTLMIVLLKARAPHKYKDRFSGELTGADGKPLINDLKITHVHSVVPLAHSEADIVQDAVEITSLTNPNEMVEIENNKP